jgi:exopolysaccharide biosynthesis protein
MTAAVSAVKFEEGSTLLGMGCEMNDGKVVPETQNNYKAQHSKVK